MRINNILAVLLKEIKDIAKNKTILIQFLIFPIMTLILTNVIAAGEDTIPQDYFAILFATMFSGMIPASTIVSIITEEKENNTLRVLIMANVTAVEYLIGIGVAILFICVSCSAVIGLIGGYSGTQLLLFTLIVFMGIVISMILGALVGIIVNNQMSGTSIIIPLSLVASFLPMLSEFDESIYKASKFVYTQQINKLLNDINIDNFTYENIGIIILNMLVLAVLFGIIFKKKGIRK